MVAMKELMVKSCMPLFEHIKHVSLSQDPFGKGSDLTKFHSRSDIPQEIGCCYLVIGNRLPLLTSNYLRVFRISMIVFIWQVVKHHDI